MGLFGGDSEETISIVETDFEPGKLYFWALPMTWSKENVEVFIDDLNHPGTPIDGYHFGVTTDRIESETMNIQELSEEQVEQLKEQLRDDD